MVGIHSVHSQARRLGLDGRSARAEAQGMPSRRGFLLALLSAALFGAATPASKLLLAGISPQVLAGLLYLGAALGLAPLCLRSPSGRARWGWPSDRGNRLRLAGAILFGGVIGPVLLLLGLELGRAASVSMWLALETTATAVLARIFFREHMGRWSWLGNVGILAAGAMLAAEGGRPAVLGALLVAGAAIAWGLDNNLTALIDGISPVQSTFWKGLVAGTTNLGLGLWLDPMSPDAAWGGALALGAVSYGASIALYISAAQALGAVRSQMVFAAAPFFGVAAALVWLGEPLGPWQLVAGLLLACSLALLCLERHAHEHTHEPLVHTHSHTHDDGHHDHAHAEFAPGRRHTHEHVHERQTHSHPHLPDLHHRHSHRARPL